MIKNDVWFVLYVKDQSRSRDFYEKTLGVKPALDVPGMCAFELAPGVTLGLMPEKSIAKILGDKTPDPASTNGAPRAELYLTVDDVDLHYRRAVAAGAKPVSGPEARGWGDIAAYAADPDSHIIAFARRNDQPDS
ncbi:MAG TPA: VOC family protein [Candidatus Wallbacteria bacterium]|nr:VOC family protein [Candidatus Wallbacteria bacterium]